MTRAPIYGTWDFNLGNNGIVGGMLTSGFAQGNNLGKNVTRVWGGTDINTIPVQLISPNLYEFDYTELTQHKAMISAVPSKSIFINKPPSFYQEYKEYVWVGSALFILLLLLLTIMTMKNRLSALKLSQASILQEELETAVSERTNKLEEINKQMQNEILQRKNTEEELSEKNQSLESFNKIAVDRELKMIELKQRISELENQEK